MLPSPGRVVPIIASACIVPLGLASGLTLGLLGGCAATPNDAAPGSATTMPQSAHAGTGNATHAPAGAHGRTASAPAAEPPADWRTAEAGILENHVQLTTREQFIKAGEAYFSPDGRQIIFQAIEVPAAGAEPEAFYQMYVADLTRDRDGRITGLGQVTQLSPPGSSNTCGWFHPTRPGRVIFASTLTTPSDPNPAGYQRDGSRYVWQFPREMTIVQCDLRTADGTTASLTPLVLDDDAYLAECALSPDGRWLVYCRRVVGSERGGDLRVRELATGAEFSLVDHDGYDGGPFFSPDGRRVCYRSDPQRNDLLQIYVTELAFDSSGNATAPAREFQLTRNEDVNWAPFWHPAGKHLVYATSELGHRNYEVFLIDADPGDGGPSRYGTSKRRITHASGFDGLPAFDATGTLMMWTSQRDETHSSQIWVADFVVPMPPVGVILGEGYDLPF